MNRIEAINFIHSNKNGKKNELIAKISGSLYSEFCLLGYIRQGVDGVGEQTWKVTSQGDSQFEFYREPSADERELGVFFAALGV